MDVDVDGCRERKKQAAEERKGFCRWRHGERK
jgi:hypothetical protein